MEFRWVHCAETRIKKKKNSLHSPDLKNLLLGTVTKFSPGACPKICLNTGREWV